MKKCPTLSENVETHSHSEMVKQATNENIQRPDVFLYSAQRQKRLVNVTGIEFQAAQVAIVR